MQRPRRRAQNRRDLEPKTETGRHGRFEACRAFLFSDQGQIIGLTNRFVLLLPAGSAESYSITVEGLNARTETVCLPIT
jgi:hypothetical protein